MKQIFSIYDRLIDVLEKKNWQKMMVIGLGTIFACLIIPLYIAGFFDIIYHSDCFGHAMGVHHAWVNNHSFVGFLQAIGAAYDRMAEIYMTWGGNYTSFFFSALQPIAFSEKLNFVGPTIFLTCFLIAQYRFLQEALEEQFGLNKTTVRVAYFIIAIMETQWLTSAREAFYWYSACITNTLGFAGSLAMLRILLKAKRENRFSNKSFAWGIFLAIFVGGCNYSSLMSLFCILFLYVVDVLCSKNIDKTVKVKSTLIVIILLVASAISIMAPGNVIRQQYNDGTNAINAIYMAVIYGRQTFFQYVDYKTVLFLFLLFPFVWNELNVKKEYRFPILVLFISAGIFCAAFAPTMKSDMSVGNRRTRNLYWYIYLNLVLLNYVYMLGWLKHKIYLLKEKEYTFTDSKKLTCILMVVFLACCTVQTEDIKYMPSVRTGIELVTGRLFKFKQQMDERNKEFNSDKREIEIKHIEYLPYVILEDKHLFANEVGETYQSEYYDKDMIRVVE